MKTKDLKPGMLVAVGSVQDFERGWCKCAMVIEAGNWELVGRYGWELVGRYGKISHRPRATGIALAIASHRDGRPTEWNRAVKLANQIRCTWEEFQAHGKRVKEREAKARAAKVQRDAERDEMAKKLSALLGVPCRIAFERCGGHYGPSHIAISFRDAESLVDTL